MEEANQKLNMILQGKEKADDAPQVVQDWLKLTIYNLADSVAKGKTRQDRAQALQKVKDNQPLFFDDVERLAKEIFKNNRK